VVTVRTEPHWRKARKSADTANCVEAAQVPGGWLVRDSKRPEDGHLTMGGAAWRGLIDAIRSGSLDL
jgi:hypothetical protein